MLNDNQKKYLLDLAQKSIEYFLQNKKKLIIDENTVDKNLKEKRGTFVTLTIENQLRGCIGHILPINPLYQDVIENAVNAAFYDPRFVPITKDELLYTDIEISILTLPQKLIYTDTNDLLTKLIPYKHGVILSDGYHSATFLPQVWEDLPDKKDFLSHLCAKAGMHYLDWQNKKLDIQTYEVEKFSNKYK